MMPLYSFAIILIAISGIGAIVYKTQAERASEELRQLEDQEKQQGVD